MAGTNLAFAGYRKNRAPAPDPKLTQVGPGTACGEYMRRFWHPVLWADEVGDRPDGVEHEGDRPPVALSLERFRADGAERPVRGPVRRPGRRELGVRSGTDELESIIVAGLPHGPQRLTRHDLQDRPVGRATHRHRSACAAVANFIALR